MLYFVGLGLVPTDISYKALNILKKVKKIYFDSYTSLSPEPLNILGEDVIRKIKIVDRSILEGEKSLEIIEEARNSDVAIMVIGDPFIATTHISLRIEAEKRGIKTKVVYAPSIYSTAISLSGLQVYKFGKSCTIVYLEERYKPVYPYIVLLENLARGLHTFFFLDFKKEENKAMKVSEAIEILLDFDKEYGVLSDPSLGIALARLGSTSEKIVVDSLENLRKENLGPPPHSLIIPGYLHPIEKDALVYIHKASNLVIDQWMKKLRKIDLESILKLLKE